ncbi:hypothetical protein AB0A91_30720 [Streptomyces sp. NPDC042207]
MLIERPQNLGRQPQLREGRHRGHCRRGARRLGHIVLLPGIGTC